MLLRPAQAIVALMLLARPLLGQSPTSGTASGIYRAASPSVFLVEVRDEAGEVAGIGSAFLVAGNRLVTNAHVVSNGRPYLRTGAVALPLSVERTDSKNDIAVLLCATPLDAAPLSFATEEPQVGSTVFAIGNPKGLERTISEGLISGRRDRAGRMLLQITAPISPGSSGGPVLNPEGMVVGVTVGYLEGGQNLNFAIPVSLVHALLSGSPSSSTFGADFAEAQRLADEKSPDYRETEAWNQYRKSLVNALERAGRSASTGQERLAVAALASEQFVYEVAARLAADAIREGLPVADSARLLLVKAWTWEVILNDSIPTSKLREMLAVADTLLVSRPRQASAHTFRGRVLSQLARGAEAVAAARRAVTLGTDDENASSYWHAYHTIVAEHGTGDEDDAVFARMIASVKPDVYDWSIHAGHLKNREKWPEAGDAFATAFRLSDFKTGEYACKAGESYWIASELDEALDALRACLRAYGVAQRVDTGHVVYANRGLAAILNQRGVYSQAETHARQALSLDPQSALSALALSEALRQQGRLSEAASAAEEAIRLSDGGDWNAHFAAGLAYFDMKDWSRCVRAFRKADEMNSSQTSAAYNTGLCLANQGYYRDAAQMMETVLRRDPNRQDRADIEAKIRVWRR